METIKILDALKQVVKSPNTTADCQAEWDVANELEIEICTSGFKEDDYRLTKYPIESWRCTDALVGSWALYFDEEPVAYITQEGRKSSKVFNWVSEEAYSRVRAYILALEEGQDCFRLIDENETISTFFSISWVSELLFEYALLGGKAVKVIDRNVDAGEYLKKRVKVAFVETGEEKIVHVAELTLPVAVNLEGD